MDARLGNRFKGAAGKRLSLVECIDEGVSNQQELQAGQAIRAMLGESRLQDARCKYIYFGWADGLSPRRALVEVSTITYYDARERQLHRSSEFRLTYPSTSAVMRRARAGDFCWMLVGAGADPDITVVVASPASPQADRLDKLLSTGLDPELVLPTRREGAVFSSGAASNATIAVDDLDGELLRLLDVEVTSSAQDALAEAVTAFGGADHPPAALFARFARDRCRTADPRDDADRALFDWFNFTYDLFIGYEEQVVQPLLNQHFANRENIDVAEFFTVASRLKNSRFSRAGGSFESHVAALFDRVGLSYDAQVQQMPDGSKPDFLLPGRSYYDSGDEKALMDVTFVGAKTTTRERWQQLVAEAQRLSNRHMFTMDERLNGRKVATMAIKRVVPVLPQPRIEASYGLRPFKGQLMPVRDFVAMATEREARLRAA